MDEIRLVELPKIGDRRGNLSIIDDGVQRKTFSLNRSYYGLYVPKMMWREMTNFSTNSVALVLSSTEYDAKDYIRDYEQFKEMKS